jgi:hypothetical protein
MLHGNVDNEEGRAPQHDDSDQRECPAGQEEEWHRATTRPLPERKAAVCNHYSMTKAPHVIREPFRVTRDAAGNLPPPPTIYPHTLAGHAPDRKTNRSCTYLVTNKLRGGRFGLAALPRQE